MKAVVFCTSHVRSNPRRLKDWVDYYVDFFKDQNVELMIINDGEDIPDFDLKGVTYIPITGCLGRQSIRIFPGWKRSFYTGLKLASAKSDFIGHVESDCFILPNGRDEFLNKLFTEGYYTGFSKHYNFPESSLQVINLPNVREYFIDTYSLEDKWHEDVDFETQHVNKLNPLFFMNGERSEGVLERYEEGHNYVSNCFFFNSIKPIISSMIS